jgi:hypothetical protein
MRRRQPTRDLDRIVNHFAQGDRATAETFAQRLAFQQFGYKIRNATIVRGHLVNGKNVGMIQRRRGALLARSVANAADRKSAIPVTL